MINSKDMESLSGIKLKQLTKGNGKMEKEKVKEHGYMVMHLTLEHGWRVNRKDKESKLMTMVIDIKGNF